MSRLRITMKKLREVIRLRFELNLGNRDIGRMLNISPSTVSLYINSFKHKGLSWEPNNPITDEELEKLFYPTKHLSSTRELIRPNFEQIHQELKKKGVTLQLLWEEYHAANGEKAYGRTQFCKMYQWWRNKLNVTMRQRHKAGDKLFIDYCGPTVPIINAKTGEIQTAQIFVAVMGASNYTYAEATWSQTLPDWIGSHVRAFSFFGGVPALLVPDNLKSAITRACRYEPDTNPTYAEMVSHYGTAVLPARPLKPRDKAKVEAGVLLVERWILARLRNHQFFSLAELNREIATLLVVLNKKLFKKLPGSRLSQFEELDKPALKSLPVAPYVFSEFKKARLGIDYHIEVDGHYYSAPYQLAKETVEVRYTENTIEIFHKNKRVGSHIRSYRKGTHTTISEHMPKKHSSHMQWTPGRLLNWGQSIGPNTLELTKKIIEKKAHPEQAYRACLGLLNLAKQFGEERLEAACQRAIHYGAMSRRSVKDILENNLDKTFLPDQPEPKTSHHENIRGPSYFSSTLKENAAC